MQNIEPLLVIDVDILEGGALIGFNNGTTALYSAALLHSILAEAEQVEPPPAKNE